MAFINIRKKEDRPKNGFSKDFKILKRFLRIENTYEFSKYDSWSI